MSRVAVRRIVLMADQYFRCMRVHLGNGYGFGLILGLNFYLTVGWVELAIGCVGSGQLFRALGCAGSMSIDPRPTVRQLTENGSVAIVTFGCRLNVFTTKQMFYRKLNSICDVFRRTRSKRCWSQTVNCHLSR